MSVDPAAAATRWAEHLPRDFARRLAAALRAGPEDIRLLRRGAALPVSAEAVRVALRLAADGQAQFAAGVLTGRLDAQAERPSVTPVWTGPRSAAAHSRLTLVVLADLIDEARAELLLASYATRPGDNVRAALTAAADSGVTITLLLERAADNPRFDGHPDPFPNLAARRLRWPATSRPPGASMHAKVLVIDRITALVGSANLTSYGLERNLECGLLIRGGPVPALLADHLLTAEGIVDESR